MGNISVMQAAMKIQDDPIAHVVEDGRVHLLSDHLHGTAERAAKFAADFGCARWGRLAGLWHDLGKYSDDFQRYIQAMTMELDDGKTPKKDWQGNPGIV